MSAALSTLLNRVPPPRRPFEIDWAAAGRSLGAGFRFPAGYRQLAEAYGPGIFGEAIRLYVPFAPVSWFDVRHQTREFTETNRYRLGLRESLQDYGRPFPYPLYPDPGGLVCWGASLDHEPLFWPTAGDPEDWPTVCENYEDLSVWPVERPAEEVVLGLLEDEPLFPAFTPIAPSERYRFMPIEDRR